MKVAFSTNPNRFSWRLRFLEWARRVKLRARLAIALTILAVASGLATYAALSNTQALDQDPSTVTGLLFFDLILLLLLAALIAHRMVKLYVTRRRNQAGSRLHVKMVGVMTMLSVTPSIIVAVFAGSFFYFGVQSWFSDRVRTAVNESLEVAQAYLKEHQQVLRADTLAMANDLNRAAFRIGADIAILPKLVDAQASVRSLNEAIVFDHSGKILARAGLSFSLSLEPISDEMLERARKGEVVLRISDDDARVRALVRLDNFVDTYLFVGRLVEPKVLAHMATTQGAVQEYKSLEARRRQIQIGLTVVFISVAVLLLLAAVWFGLNFAGQMVRPIGNLINAAERVRAGDLTARVSRHDAEINNELGMLGNAFNRMTSQLQSQRNELIVANRQLDQRRRFTEAVLATVPAGVIGIDAERCINLVNQAARDLFTWDPRMDLSGQKIAEAIPELGELLGTLIPGARQAEGEIEIRRSGQPTRTLLVRIAAEMSAQEIRSYVVTFDDVSDLLSAQRKAAWADVARRIAHEIKNPLTPIQLAAERLRRRYLHEIKTDPEIFAKCTETIMRQVDDIGRMVDEFSAFARMPVPVLQDQDINELCRQAVFMQSTGRPDINFIQELPTQAAMVICDGRQVAQALTNILKNATEAVDGRTAGDHEDLPQGQVILQVKIAPEHILIIVTDNGKGLPIEDRNRLAEPYVTTRSKGTGLGLAIVKKIVEDHRGSLLLADRPDGKGAQVTLSLPRHAEASLPLADEDDYAHTDDDQAILRNLSSRSVSNG
ncbi:MAG: PAS domain-containing sensor histidine kinase [Alphaproteobacteria bacterium]